MPRQGTSLRRSGRNAGREKISGRRKNGNKYDYEGDGMSGGGLEGKPGRDRVSGSSKAENRNGNGYQI